MFDTSALWLYFVVVFAVIVLPGMDMAFVMGSSLAGGRRAGLAAVAGVVAGGVAHLLISGTGIGVLLSWSPLAFTLLLWLGVAYIAWIGWSLLRLRDASAPVPTTHSGRLGPSFLRGLATCLLNPKAYVFMLAIFPQFIHTERGPVWAQAAVLGLITALTQIAVYGSLAVGVARARRLLAIRPQRQLWLARSAGLVLILSAVLTLYRGLGVAV